ncbi:MAG TPA: hypothetical protein VGA78_10865, partial [Gemmatimonadales bacterium]
MIKDGLSSPMGNRRGATLPLVILFLVLLSMSALGGISRVATERRTGGNIRAEVDAFTLAQAGLDRYLSTVTDPPPASLDTTITDVFGGNVSVSVRRLRDIGSGVPALYVVRATATHTAARRYDARTPAAVRSVAQFALWETMRVPGAWTALGGINKSGGSGTLAGADQCGVEPPVSGVAVPITAADGGPGYDQAGGTSVPTGIPPISYPDPTPQEFANNPLINIDWDGIVNGGAMTFDYNLTSTTGWPASFTSWPSIYVNNTAELSLSPVQSGSGLLVVRRDLKLDGAFSWNGVILVGGKLTSSGTTSVYGGLITGLNLKLGEAVQTSDLGNGTKFIQYNSCHVNNALDKFGTLNVLRNAWVDNWPIY